MTKAAVDGSPLQSSEEGTEALSFTSDSSWGWSATIPRLFDPLDAFRDLRDDIQNHCLEFLEGANGAFLRRIEDARVCWASRPKLPGKCRVLIAQTARSGRVPRTLQEPVS